MSLKAIKDLFCAGIETIIFAKHKIKKEKRKKQQATITKLKANKINPNIIFDLAEQIKSAFYEAAGAGVSSTGLASTTAADGSG